MKYINGMDANVLPPSPEVDLSTGNLVSVEELEETSNQHG